MHNQNLKANYVYHGSLIAPTTSEETVLCETNGIVVSFSNSSDGTKYFVVKNKTERRGVIRMFYGNSTNCNTIAANSTSSTGSISTTGGEQELDIYCQVKGNTIIASANHLSHPAHVNFSLWTDDANAKIVS